MRQAHFCGKRVAPLSLILCAFVLLSGCTGGADEELAIEQLRELGALVVPDVNKHASSVVLPNDAEKIQQALPLLLQLPYLTSVGAINTPISDEALETVGRLRRLTNVDVSGTSITDKGVRHLVGLSKLSSLNLAGTNVTSACLPDVGKLSGIDVLNLANTSLSGGFEHLAGCEELSWLVLSNLTLTDADATALAEHPNLKRISASDAVRLSSDAKAKLLAKGIQLDLSADAVQESADGE